MAEAEIKIDTGEAEAATRLLGAFIEAHPRRGDVLKRHLMQLSFADKAFRSNYERKSGVVFADMTDDCIGLLVSHGAVQVPEIASA